MKSYIIRRLLLVPITLLGITFIVFSLTRIMPGGPIEQMMQKLNQADTDGKSSVSGSVSSANSTVIERLEEEFGYNKSIPIAYFNWLGVLPRERSIEKKELITQTVSVKTDSWGVIFVERRGNRILSVKNSNKQELDNLNKHIKLSLNTEGRRGYRLEVQDGQQIQTINYPSFSGENNDIDSTVQAQIVILEDGNRVLVTVDPVNPEEVKDMKFIIDTGTTPEQENWLVEVQTPEERRYLAAKRARVEISKVTESFDYRVKIYKTKFEGVLQGSFGDSIKYQDSVISMIIKRMPISFYFGILSTIIIYGVCLPLGITKAIRHRTLLDNASSILIFIGYSIPGYALGGLLLVYLGARAGWFPLFGLMSPDADGMNFIEKIVDLAHHTILPLIAYVIAGFATTTMLMKNSLMDNLSSDYVRTAVAKGVKFKSAVFKHAFKNSFIPIATDLGGLITIFVGGSMLIEKVFDIQGFGLLSFTSVEERDHPVIMGALTISAFLMLIGNILSDIIVAMIDPRIKFK